MDARGRNPLSVGGSHAPAIRPSDEALTWAPAAAPDAQDDPTPRAAARHEGGENDTPEPAGCRMVQVYNEQFELIRVPATTGVDDRRRDERSESAHPPPGHQGQAGTSQAAMPLVPQPECPMEAAALSAAWTASPFRMEPALAELLAQSGVSESAVEHASLLPRTLFNFMAAPHAGFRSGHPAVDAAHSHAIEARVAMARAMTTVRRVDPAHGADAHNPAATHAATASRGRQVVTACHAEAPTPPPTGHNPVTVDGIATGPVTSGSCVTAQEEEQAAKRKQASLLATLIGQDQVAIACGYRPDEWRGRDPDKLRNLWERHIVAYSEGQIRGARCALVRLSKWLASQGLLVACAGWTVSGGLLCEWVLDEQSASKSAGDSIPNNLRNFIRWSSSALKLSGLAVDDEAFRNISAPPARQPTPALAATVAMLFHFSRLATAHHQAIVRHYAAGFVLVVLAALRVRDAQRARIKVYIDAPPNGASVEGVCYTSKHPRRRAPMPMPFWVPRSNDVLGDWQHGLQYLGPDYTFPAVQVPRGSAASIADPRAVVQQGPARSRYVIKYMRVLLRMDDFTTEAQAKRFSGHSGRHTLVTVARLLCYKHEDRRELGRWLAALGDGKERRAAMANAYSSEAERPRVLEVISRILLDIKQRVPSPGELSPDDPWAPFRAQRDAASGSADAETIRAEASSSESDAFDTET